MNKVYELIEKSLAGEELSFEDAAELYETDPLSREAYTMRWAAMKKSMELAGGLAEIHGQIGLDTGPCLKNCRFCSFAGVNLPPGTARRETPLRDVLAYAEQYAEDGTNAILLMSTEEYDFNRYLEVCLRVRETIGDSMPLLANTRDLTETDAKRLKAAGIDGIYHAVRLGEGELTSIPIARRMETIVSARKAGLGLSTCIEPIGPEHTAQEITRQADLCKSLAPITSGVGRRVAVPGTLTASRGMLSQPRNAVIAAAYRLTDHKTKLIASAHSELMAGSGCNIAWSEVGSNRRDTKERTESGIGRATAAVRRMFIESGWEVRRGPAPGWREV